jgi:hypothetical protein
MLLDMFKGGIVDLAGWSVGGGLLAERECGFAEHDSILI